MRRAFRCSALAALILLLAACGGQDSANGATVVLSQTTSVIDDVGGTLTVRYPASWAASNEGGQIRLASSQSALRISDTSALREGEVQGFVVFFPPPLLSFFNITDVLTPSEALTTIVDTIFSDGDTSIALGDPASFTVSGWTAAAATGTGTRPNGRVVESTFVVVLHDGIGYAMLALAGMEGQLARFEAEARAIAGSIVYIPPGG